MQKCWSEHVWVGELSTKFFEFSLRLLHRYCQWFEDGMFASSGQDTEGEDDGDSGAAGTATVSTTAPTPNGGGGGNGGSWNSSSVPFKVLVFLLVDVGRMDKAVRECLAPAIAARVQLHQVPGVTGAEGGAASVVALLASPLSRLNKLHPILVERVASILTHKCGAFLQAIPKIKSSFRMNTSFAPDKPSNYVEEMVSHFINSLQFGQIVEPGGTFCRAPRQCSCGSQTVAAGSPNPFRQSHLLSSSQLVGNG